MHLTEEQRCLLWLSAAKITPAHATMLAELGTLEVMGLICRETGNRFHRTL